MGHDGSSAAALTQAASSADDEVFGAPRIGPKALDFLACHKLDDGPRNYAFAYAVCRDRAGLAAMMVDAVLIDRRRLSQEDADRIMAAQPVDAVGAAFWPRRTAQKRSETTHVLAPGAADTVHHLSGGGASVERITAAVVERARKVETQLQACSDEVEALHHQVHSVRDEAERDHLTGLLNRRGMFARLRARDHTWSGMIAICDVDHFKSINDRYGHAMGDRVLQQVATALADACDGHAVARWGGEEFLIVLDRIDSGRALRLLERARAAVAALPIRCRETDAFCRRVTISIGAAALGGAEPERAIEVADRLLYEAKHAGRDRIAIGG